MSSSNYTAFTWVDAEQWTLQAYCWLPTQPIKGVVQIVHGMTEHALNYQPFAEFLTRNGYAVYAHDQRGHGQTAKLNPPLGYLGDNGWDALVENINQLHHHIHKQHPNVPLFILGHSMGSYLTQAFCAKYGQSLDGIMLSGSSFESGYVTYPSKILANALCLLYGKKSKGTLFYNIIYGGFNRHFSPNRTAFDWLSRNETAVDQYVQDPNCGFVPSLSFFQALFHGLYSLYGQEDWQMISRHLPIYLFSGDQDPLSKFGKTFKTLLSIYRKRGNPIEYHLYEHGRHVMLSEINAEVVYQHCLEWLDKQEMAYRTSERT